MSIYLVFTKLTSEEKEALARKLEMSVTEVEAQLRDPNSIVSKKHNNELLDAILEMTAIQFITRLKLENILSAERAEELSLLSARDVMTVVPVNMPVSTVRPDPQQASNDAIRAASQRVKRAEQNFARAEAALYDATADLRDDGANQLALDLAPANQPLQRQIALRVHRGFGQLRPDMARSVQRVANGDDRVLVARELRERGLEVMVGLLNELMHVEEQAKLAVNRMLDQFFHGYYANAPALFAAAKQLAEARQNKEAVMAEAYRYGFAVVEIHNHPAPSAGNHMLGRPGVPSAPNQNDLGPDTAAPQNKTQPPGGLRLEPSARSLNDEEKLEKLREIMGQSAANSPRHQR